MLSVRAGPLGVGLGVGLGGCWELRMRSRGLGAVLSARPGVPGQRRAAGVERLGLGAERDGVLFVPRRALRGAHPLIVLLHGAGGDWGNILGLLEARAEETGCAMLVPDSRDYTWDVIVGGFGADVRFLDRALEHTFSRCDVDAERVAIAGFSDGGSYALTMGLANGNLFRQIMAFSPGFQAAPTRDGLPRVFVSHGTDDRYCRSIGAAAGWFRSWRRRGTR